MSARRVIFYLVRSKVYHILGTEKKWDEERTLCGWRYRSVKERVNLYYEAKLGTDWEDNGAAAYGRRLCTKCAKREALRALVIGKLMEG